MERKAYMSEIYIVAGGDMRFPALAEQLSEKYTVYTVGMDKQKISCEKAIFAESLEDIPCPADCLILPLPVSSDGKTLNAPFSEKAVPLSQLADIVKDNGKVMGGMITPEVKEIFSVRGIEVTDYFKREELAVSNALATAEGALQIALEEQPTIISGSSILITGMGRISKALIRILSGFGAEITVCARKYSDLAWAQIYGCKTVMLSKLVESDALKKADIIFNTVPHIILTEPVLKECSRKCLIIDLASKPGGLDIQSAVQLGLRIIWALSLPGKCAPVSSGRMIAQAIENILSEQNTHDHSP